MSPAPQGNLEVEHYIGSCLISARIPSQTSNSSAKNQQPNNKHHNHYQNFYHHPGGKISGNDNAGGGDGRLVRQQQQQFVNKLHQQRPDCHAGGVGGGGGQASRYHPMPLPLAAATADYSNGGHFMQPARHHSAGGGSGSGWAGMPLISMTSGNGRRKKNKGGPPAGINNKAGVKIGHQTTAFSKNKEVDCGVAECGGNAHVSECCRSPLSRLAIHTQGAPLIQANRYSNHNRNRSNYNRGDQQSRVYGGGDVAARRTDVGKETTTARVTVTTANCQPKESTATASSSSSSDSLSVASDESSGNSENSLPRIIKPRKRRKKDRKPPATTTTTTTTTSATTPSSSAVAVALTPASLTVSLTQLPSNENQCPLEENSSVVTLQPYLPLCFESYENPVTQLPVDVTTSETAIAEKRTENDRPFEDLTASVVDEFPFGNLLDDEDDANSDLSSCGPATLCQCRYCDPSGVIWDVDQRCYSPFLTPPSPTDKMAHFSKSLPPAVFLESAVRSFGQQMSSPPLASAAMTSYTLNDFGTMLRRSWSDPSSDINMGIAPRLLCHDPSSGSLEKRNVVKNGDEKNSVAQLQVSSEIVTSPNGHRDIEIKFYSSNSAPKWPNQEEEFASTVKRCASNGVSSSLLDYNARKDRPFVVEE